MQSPPPYLSTFVDSVVALVESKNLKKIRIVKQAIQSLDDQSAQDVKAKCLARLTEIDPELYSLFKEKILEETYHAQEQTCSSSALESHH